MKFFVSIFIIFMIAVRPVLPLVNYAVNYEYIAKNLCENRSRPQSTCKGKCYIEKELAKTEKQTTNTAQIKISALDVFIPHENPLCLHAEILDYSNDTVNSAYPDIHLSEYSAKIFHPPLG
ncbi:hypothetical protein [Chryseobacterium daecheongense]|nr:hypothetical protein [Chryseobacterium daecheongense]